MDDFQSIFNSIVQVIGVAYTYQPSRAMRRNMTADTAASHSSQHSNFSYFYKGDRHSISQNHEPLFLRKDPVSGELAKHWAEPEIAILLGERHQIIGYTLANDLTAITIEIRGRTNEVDGTFLGKAWHRSGSIGPRLVPSYVIENSPDQKVGLRIARRGVTIYNQTYHTSRRLREFREIPGLIVSYSKRFGENPPPSKQILIDSYDFLPSGTVIMLGTGLITRGEYYCQEGDTLTIYCDEIGELTNKISSETE